MSVVQFMHPGGEVDVYGNTVQWNLGNRHCRRLLCHAGEYVDGNNIYVRDDHLCFWNEYEAPTYAHPIQPHRGWNFVHHYHTIIRPIPPSPNRQNNRQDDILDDECCDNTDPCVFGDTFKYSNCQQVQNGDLWNLSQGSLILFGSLHARMFYLDTVFVTQNLGVRYSVPIANHQLPFTTSSEYRTVTLDNLRPTRNGRNRRNSIINQFMFYRGKLPTLGADGHVDAQEIFSFTPTRILNTHDFNERFRIDLAVLNQRIRARVRASRQFAPNLPRGHKTVVFNASQADVATIWREVRDAVINASFMLGCHFAW